MRETFYLLVRSGSAEASLRIAGEDFDKYTPEMLMESIKLVRETAVKKDVEISTRKKSFSPPCPCVTDAPERCERHEPT